MNRIWQGRPSHGASCWPLAGALRYFVNNTRNIVSSLPQMDTAPRRRVKSDFAFGSKEELRRFAELQGHLVTQFREIFPDPARSRTVVVVPSLSVDRDLLFHIEGIHHYEERLLFMLMLLRLPRTRVIYLTSQPIASTIVDYYLHLLPGIPGSHARRRLTLLSCYDASRIPLSAKILQRPLLLERIRAEIGDTETAHLTVFNATHYERSLAVCLGVPIYACDPALSDLGSKSGSREIFREAGILMPSGAERLRDMRDVAEALVQLRAETPDLNQAVVKMNDGFGGEGNATFCFEGAPEGADRARWVQEQLPLRLKYEAHSETWGHFSSKFEEMSGVVEAYVEGPDKRSPSVQCRIDPLGSISVISTHDQDLGGPTGQIYRGCSFPANRNYAADIQEAGLKVAEELRARGALGRFGIDFVSVKQAGTWRHHAIEINLRKGGTTHPYLMLQYLTNGDYDPEALRYYTAAGQERYYYASDDLQRPALFGLTPEDIIDLAVFHKLHFHGATQEGVVFHLIGAVSQFGKIGILCIADSHAASRALFKRTVRTLEEGNCLPDR